MSFIDLVISGPDMSGTSTQINDCIQFFKAKGIKIRDIRGTEIEALFHAERYHDINHNHINLKSYISDPETSEDEAKDFIYSAFKLLSGGNTNQDLNIASMVNNDVSTYIDPDSADVWIMEEPTKRGAGQVNRTIEQNRTKYRSELDPLAAAHCHQVYRIDEFLRFRRPLREKGKIIIRSRSEESACYQIKDNKVITTGPSIDEYLSLPGHQIAFGYPPTHLFIVCALSGWTPDEYIKLKKERSNGRAVDDHENNVNYQILVNERYRTSWLDELYYKGCDIYGSSMPNITKFELSDNKEIISQRMEKRIIRL